MFELVSLTLKFFQEVKCFASLKKISNHEFVCSLEKQVSIKVQTQLERGVKSVKQIFFLNYLFMFFPLNCYTTSHVHVDVYHDFVPCQQ